MHEAKSTSVNLIKPQLLSAPSRAVPSPGTAPGDVSRVVGNQTILRLQRSGADFNAGESVPSELKVSDPEAETEREASTTAGRLGPWELDQQKPTIPNPAVGQIRGSSGHPLSESLLSEHDHSMRPGLSQVRVHNDPVANVFARGIGAEAATWGSHIYFGKNRWDPQSNAGKQLLTHELRHTLQPEAESVVHRAPDNDAALQQINKELSSLVITDERRAELEQRRAAITMRPKFDLLALADEAKRRNEASSVWTSTEEEGPSSVTVPITELITVPESLDGPALFNAVAANPEEEQARDLAARHVVTQYMQDKLDWPVKIDLVDSGNGFWFSFSIHGEDLVASQTLQLPLSALDSVSVEPLKTVTDRAAQIVEVAVLDAASTEIVGNIGDLPEKMIEDPADYPRNKAKGLKMLADRYMGRIETLSKSLLPYNEWLVNILQNRRAAFVPVLERVAQADNVTRDYLANNQPPTYAAETYDRVVAEAGNFVSRGWWKTWRFLGDVVTLGGQSAQGENVGMYRRGEISYNDYKKNWVLAIGAVAVKAIIAAVTAGRGGALATRFLGLEAGTTAAAVAEGMAEGAASNFVVAFSGDIYSKAVAMFSSSPGVIALHERLIGGVGSWFEAAAWGGMVGGEMSFAGALVPETPLDPTKIAREPLPGSAESTIAQLTEADLRIISADLDSGEFTVAVRHPATGELFYASGNVETGMATVRNMSTGEVVGHIRAGEFGAPAPGGGLMPGEPVMAEPSVAPSEKTGVVGPVEDVQLGAKAEPTPVAGATGEQFGPPSPRALMPGESLTSELGGEPLSESGLVSVAEEPLVTAETPGPPTAAELKTQPKVVKQGSRVLDPKKRIRLAAAQEQIKSSVEAEREAISSSQTELDTLEEKLEELRATPKVRPAEIDQAFRRLSSIKDLETRIEALEKLKQETGLSSAAREYLEWQEKVMRVQAEILDIKEGNVRAGEAISTAQKVDLPGVEAALRSASKPIKALLRKVGPNYRAMKGVKFDQIMGEKAWNAFSKKLGLETDHLFAVTRIANLPELKGFLETYEKAPDVIKARMVDDLVALADKPENLVRMNEKANNIKSGRSWDEITYDEVKEYYDAPKVDEYRAKEATQKAEITKAVLDLTAKYEALTKTPVK